MFNYKVECISSVGFLRTESPLRVGEKVNVSHETEIPCTYEVVDIIHSFVRAGPKSNGKIPWSEKDYPIVELNLISVDGIPCIR